MQDEINKKDTVTYQGRDCEVYEDRSNKYIRVLNRIVYLNDIQDEITLKTKYFAKMLYAGAEATVLACAKDSDMIIYLELVGHEDMVKSITSVIMQGRIKMNDQYLSYTEGYFNVHRGGTRRILKQIGDGYAHAILYHSPSVSDTNFSCLLGKTEDDTLNSFKSWLQLTSPLPYPPELVEDLLGNLVLKGKVEKLDCYGSITGIKMDRHLGDNEYEAFQEIILDTAWEKGIANKYIPAVTKAEEVVESKVVISNGRIHMSGPLMTPMQQTDARRYLISRAPVNGARAKEINGAYKVAAKFFFGMFTWYATEYDAKDDIAYGYVVNHRDDWCSEWGSFWLKEIFDCGAERDLYFDDEAMINIDGEIVEKAVA